MNIETFDFDNNSVKNVEANSKGSNWPVVYLIYNDKNLYIGETTCASRRMSEHLKDPRKISKNFKSIKIIFDDTFNKSVVLDYEQRLIKMFKADRKYREITNRNPGQSEAHNYYQRNTYEITFEEIWAELVKQGIARNKINEIRNDNLFKFSPWTSLTYEQKNVEIDVLTEIYDCLSNNKKGVSVINGSAGTGKTVLAINIIYSLIKASLLDVSDLTSDELDDPLIRIKLKIKDFILHTKPLKIGFVFPMTGIRSVIYKVFKESGDGFSGEMVIGPTEIKNEKYDILFVDEAHRLLSYDLKTIGTQYNSYINSCNYFKIQKEGSNQLDWALLGSKYTVLFYDEDQNIRSSDLTYNDFQKSLYKYGDNVKKFSLTSQMRCEGGDAYIKYIKDIMNCCAPSFQNVNNYEFFIYNDVDKMINDIQTLDYKDGKENNLCKTVAGFSWDWATHLKKDTLPDTMDFYNNIKNSGKFDIEIQGHKYIWNLVTKNWIPRKDSHYTIGCIHTTQGFDLNYVGLIFGKEIDYDEKLNKIVVDLDEFKDKKAKAGCDVETAKRFIINAYTTMMARGIKGCYVFAYNEKLRNYLKKYIKVKL